MVPKIADLMWNSAMNQRLGTSGLKTAAIYAEAQKVRFAWSIAITVVLCGADIDSFRFAAQHDGR